MAQVDLKFAAQHLMKGSIVFICGGALLADAKQGEGGAECENQCDPPESTERGLRHKHASHDHRSGGNAGHVEKALHSAGESHSLKRDLVVHQPLGWPVGDVGGQLQADISHRQQWYTPGECHQRQEEHVAQRAEGDRRTPSSPARRPAVAYRARQRLDDGCDEISQECQQSERGVLAFVSDVLQYKGWQNDHVQAGPHEL